MARWGSGPDGWIFVGSHRSSKACLASLHDGHVLAVSFADPKQKSPRMRYTIPAAKPQTVQRHERSLHPLIALMNSREVQRCHDLDSHTDCGRPFSRKAEAAMYRSLANFVFAVVLNSFRFGGCRIYGCTWSEIRRSTRV